ncbi:MAG: homoserine kinase [Actinomycetota bacterium]
MRLSARVPATSANLGPGFDCFGLALDLCNEVTVDTDAEPGVGWEGEGADELPTDGSDLVSRAMCWVAERAGQELGPFQLHGLNRIPLERGLGSSAAAAVAGVAIARAWLRLADRDDREIVFRAAADIERHPDNAAAATYGGLTVVADGSVRRFDVAPGIRPVVLVPEHLRMPTEEARRVLPSQVRLSDAVRNVAHGALVISALVSGDFDLLRVGLRDRLHQDVRLSLVPEVREVFERLASQGVPVCVSGAGPSLLGFEDERHPTPHPGGGWRLLRLASRVTGIEVQQGAGETTTPDL